MHLFFSLLKTNPDAVRESYTADPALLPDLFVWNGEKFEPFE
jgi:hypothetical protein